MTEERRKPSDIAVAESKAWQQGIHVARRMKQTFLDERVTLMHLGWPAAHALCQELDKGAAQWAAQEMRMREDYVAHAQENHIQL